MSEMTLRERLNRFPPFLCRSVARKGRGYEMLNLREIAKRSGLPLATVSRIAYLRTWDSLSLGVIERFSLACGVDVLHPRRHVDWLKRRKKLAWRGRETTVRKLLKP